MVPRYAGGVLDAVCIGGKSLDRDRSITVRGNNYISSNF